MWTLVLDRGTCILLALKRQGTKNLGNGVIIRVKLVCVLPSHTVGNVLLLYEVRQSLRQKKKTGKTEKKG